jgi:hypothetical protein
MTEGKNIHQRLAAVMGEVTYVQKEKKAGMNYTIVSHDAVTAKVRPVLLKHGIVYYPVRCQPSQEGNRAASEMTVRFVNVDEPTDFFEVPTFGYGIDPQDKGPGKAMSYAVKYALLKALGLETGDDPDHDDQPYEPVKAPTGKATALRQIAAPVSQSAAAPLSQQAAAPATRTLSQVVDGLHRAIATSPSRAALKALFDAPTFKPDYDKLRTTRPEKAAELDEAADRRALELAGDLPAMPPGLADAVRGDDLRGVM